jgi:hypothetical protein
MNVKQQTFRGLATAIFACVSVSTAFSMTLPITSSWAQHKVSSGKFAIHSACMMPPQAHLARIGMKGAEGMTKESDTWAAALEDMVEAHLKSDGVAINSATSLLSSGASNDEIGSVISQIQQKFASVEPLMRKKPGGIGKSAYTLGDQVGMLPCSENSDILVFVQGVGQVVTDGRASMTLLIGGPAEDAVVLVTMADAKTGEIISFTQVYPNDSSLLKAEDAFGEKLYQQFVVMNIGAARKNAKAQGH